MSPKGFTILAAATAISLGLAAWAVAGRDLPTSATGQTQPMFAGLLDRLDEVKTIKVTGAGEMLTLRRSGDGKWQVEERGGYPADPKQVRELALGLANLQLVEAKTAKPERLARLDLADPDKPDAKSHEVTLLDKDGKPLAAAIVGKTKYGLYGGGRSGVYVRRAGEQQAWIAAGQLDVPNGPAEVMPHEVMDVSPDDIARVTLAANSPSPIVIARTEKAGPYTLQTPVPDGKKADNEKLERVADTLSKLSMEDVKPLAAANVPADAPQARFETWDGLRIEARVAKTGEGDKAEHWVTFAVAQGEPIATAPAPAPAEGAKPAEAADTKPVADRVAELKAKLDGWAFKLPEYEAARLTWTVNDLLASGDGTS